MREVIASPHTHQTLANGYHRYAGSSSAESPRYTGGSSSGSGVDSPAGYAPRYATNTLRSASVIGIPKYEGKAAKRHLNGYTNHAFRRSASNSSLNDLSMHPTHSGHQSESHRLQPMAVQYPPEPVRYIDVSTLPRKGSSLSEVPRLVLLIILCASLQKY